MEVVRLLYSQALLLFLLGSCVIRVLWDRQSQAWVEISVEHDVPAYKYSFIDHHDLGFCNKHNFIPLPDEQVIRRNENNTRPFSIRAEDFERHHERTCSSVDELLNAIKNGARHWNDSSVQELSLLEREAHPSTFVPSDCDIPLRSPREVCNVLNRFSHVVIQGDSLSRHTQGGLLMTLRNDVIQGSIISSKASMYNCRCDAQFCENKKCRLNDGLYNQFKPYQLGLCPELQVKGQFESVFNINRLHRGVYRFPGVNCTAPNNRGILVIVQGGVHMKYNAFRTYKSLVAPFFKDPTFRTCAQAGKVIFIWTAYHAQSESYNDKYPHQALDRGTKFDREMARHFVKHNVTNASTVEWINFTTGAQHSDGLHYAAQVNYFKAQHLVALADLMWKEGMSLAYRP